MVTLDWRLERSDGVTLVGLFVESERSCRVRIENRLDGPVWPPRRRGQPCEGWDDSGFAGVVPADGRLTLGYATSAKPAEPPAAVVSTEGVPAEAAEPGGGCVAQSPAGSPLPDSRSRSPAGRVEGDEPTAGAVVRSLGNPVVPRDAVPVPDGPATSRSDGAAGLAGEAGDGGGDRCGEGGGASNGRGGIENAGSGSESTGSDSEGTGGEAESTGGKAESTGSPAENGGNGAVADSGAASERGPADGSAAAGEFGRAADGPVVVPGAVRAWLDDVERRLDAVEGAATVDGNTAEGRADDRTAGSALAAAVTADRRALSWLDSRLDALAARAERRADGR